ncbi:hypothetical protein J2847_006140 [Azospirillum agricola]|uniref:hypothetical protein n=1 Tax=Azospirillum agricola TaxID=1720247 RepID=UPI001AE60365|nr:hypothetical protein [Azospirillum agricola]MBP2232806.1 hypothetical protein [Azospirillum agricola]
MNTLDRHDGALRFSYAAEDGRRVHGQHDPAEGVLALRVSGPGGRLLHEDNLPCDDADRLLSALAAWGETPDAVRDALPSLGGNAILLDTLRSDGAPVGAVRASVRRHGLKVGVVFLDRAGGRVAELRAGSLEALERKAGRALRLSRATRRVLGGWLSGEPLWLGAVLIGGPFLGSLLASVQAGLPPEQLLLTAYAGAVGLVAAFELLRAQYAAWVQAPSEGVPPG